MEEIKEGEYVRTNKGIIYKATDNIIMYNRIPKKYKKLINVISKHSKNLTDIIQEKDYINGYLVRSSGFDNELKHYIYMYKDERIDIKNLDIKTVLTKEQYEQNCYNIKEGKNGRIQNL